MPPPPRGGQKGQLVSTRLVGSIGCLSSCAGCLSIQPLLRPLLCPVLAMSLCREGIAGVGGAAGPSLQRQQRHFSPLGLLLQTEKQI